MYRVQTQAYPDDREVLSEVEWQTVPGGTMYESFRAIQAAQVITEQQLVPSRVLNERGAVVWSSEQVEPRPT